MAWQQYYFLPGPPEPGPRARAPGPGPRSQGPQGRGPRARAPEPGPLEPGPQGQGPGARAPGPGPRSQGPNGQGPLGPGPPRARAPGQKVVFCFFSKSLRKIKVWHFLNFLFFFIFGVFLLAGGPGPWGPLRGGPGGRQPPREKRKK